MVDRIFALPFSFVLLTSSLLCPALEAQERVDSDGLQFFEKHIRPVLAKEQGDGRDHNSKGFSMWMAGGGVKQGFTYGTTDDYGYEAVEGRVHMHDWHATILHLLGLDHEQLTYRYAGRDMRLTDVKGNVAKDIIT